MRGSQKRDRITITIPPELYEKVDALATKEVCSFSQAITKILKQYFDQVWIAGEPMVDYRKEFDNYLSSKEFSDKIESIIREVLARVLQDSLLKK